MKNSISKKQLREFGFLIGFGFPLLIGWLLPAIGGHLFRSWTLWVGSSAFVLGVLNPLMLLYPYRAWMKLGYVLGWLNSRIVLGLIFFLVLQPIAMVMKLFGHDPLRKKWNKSKTYKEINQDHKIDLTRIF